MKKRSTKRMMLALATVWFFAAGLTAGVKEVYTEYDSLNKGITYYYDDQRASRTGTTELYTGNPSDSRFLNYSEDVEYVVMDESMQDAPLTSLACMFVGKSSADGGEARYLSNVKYIKLFYLNTDNVTDMQYMFEGCSSLNAVCFSGRCNTANVTNMEGMFKGCTALETLYICHFNTRQVQNMQYMFYACSSLEYLNISGFRSDNLRYASKIFYGCSSLKTIVCSHDWSLNPQISNHSMMFYGCTALVGENGTDYSAAGAYANKTYARPDGGVGSPGYFTRMGNEVYTEFVATTGTLTFYCDDQRFERTGRTELYDPIHYPESKTYSTYHHHMGAEIYEYSLKVIKAVIDPSMQNANLTSTRYMFKANGGYSNMTAIEGMENLITDNVTDMRYMFEGCQSLSSLDLSHFNTENVTDMQAMFAGCGSPLDFSSFNTENVTNMSRMFINSKLTSLDISHLNTRNVTTMERMFCNCRCPSINWGQFSGENVKNTERMFEDCITPYIDLSYFNAKKITNATFMFNRAKSTTVIDVSGIDCSNSTVVSSRMFYDCRNLTTIISDDNWAGHMISSEMFTNCPNLVGGNGTMYCGGHSKYARLDGLDGKPGYFTKSTYTVTFLDSDGNVLGAPQSIHYGRAATPPAPPAVSGYHFTDWDSDDYLNVKADLTITAQYEINQYTVRFLDKDGAPIGEAQTIAHGSAALAPTPPAVEGYHFIAWDKAFDNITSDLDVTAQYAINTYTVRFFDKDNNQIGADQTVKHGYSPVAPVPPVVEGYTFTGWDTWYFDVTSDLDVHAVYEVSTYTVRFFDKDNNQIGASQTVKHGYSPVAPVAPTVEGYTFLGWDTWYFDVTSDLDVHALYEINTYTVRFFDKDNNQIGASQTVKHGYSPVAPVAPTVEGYTFTGWDNAFDNITSDLDVTAQYAINTYTVKFLDKDNNQIGATQTIEHGSAAEAPTPPAVTGYTFSGWDNDFDNITEDLVITALYLINVYTVQITLASSAAGDEVTAAELQQYMDLSYNYPESANNSLEYSSGVLTGTLEYGAVLNTSANKLFYEFDHWSDNTGDADRDFTMSGNIALTLYLNPVQLTIQAVCEAVPGTINVTGETSFPFNERNDWSLTLTANPETGWVFDGWVPELEWEEMGIKPVDVIDGYKDMIANAEEYGVPEEEVNFVKTLLNPALILKGSELDMIQNFFNLSPNGEFIMRAVFVKAQYTVTFVDKDGDPIEAAQTIEHGSAAVAPTPPVVEGYTFTGWDNDFDNITANLTVQAQYTINQYTVKFLDKDDNPLKTETVNWNETATAPADPAWAGHTFTGWDTDFAHVKSDLTIRPQYDTQLYDVLFADWDGTELKTDKVEYGNAATPPANPSRTGYTFTGWDKAYNNITGDLTVTAQYAINTYTVKFLDKDGAPIGAAQTIAYGSAALAPTPPAVTGYTFTGWDNAFNNITADLTVTAQYTINQYTVKFLDKDGAPLGATQVITHGNAAVAPTPPAVTGYTFTGWDNAFDNITANLTVQAQYTINTYTVKFLDKDGTPIGAAQTIAYGNAAVAPTPPAVTGYTFTGWDNAFNNITADLTVTAQYTINQYTVKFVDWNGTELKSGKVNYGSAAIAPANPNRTGYTFSGWDKAFNNITADLTVTAQYTVNQYTVTFVDWNGTELKSGKVNYGSAAVAPADPSRTGYTFTGWDKAFNNISADLTVRAQYTINTYTVKFMDKDNNQIGATQTIEHGSAAVAPTPPAVTGYTFSGWDKAFGAVSADLVVTAQYTINSYTVKFVDWNGTELKSGKVTYGSAAVAPANPSRTGYTFTGWDKAYNNITGDLTVTAQYAINTYTVKFLDKDGAPIGAAQTIAYGSAALAPTPPAVTGYTFSGWDKAYNNITADLTVTAQYTINVYTVQITLASSAAGDEATAAELQQLMHMYFSYAANANNSLKLTDGVLSGTLEYGSSLNINAQDGFYLFDHWSDNTGTAERTFTVTGNTGLTLYLQPQTITLKTVCEAEQGTTSVSGETSFAFHLRNTWTATLKAEPENGMAFAGWVPEKDWEAETTTPEQLLAEYTDIIQNNGEYSRPENEVNFLKSLFNATLTLKGSEFDLLNSYLQIDQSGTMPLRAVFRALPKYTVTFIDKDGAPIGAAQTVIQGQGAIAPTPPAVEGYTFTGWDKAFGSITGNLTVQAQYTINSYTVTFTDKDGNTLKTETVNWNEAATAPSTPVWEGHTFTGWDNDFTHVKSDMTVKPQYDTQLYTVRFVDWNGSELKAEKVAYGNGATAPVNPTREGYTFKSWDKAFSNITGDITVKALYEINHYTVRFIDWNDNELKSEQVEYGSGATAPADPSRTGYTFSGWDKAYNNISGDLTVQAQYTINQYTVTFLDWNGNELKAEQVEYGKSATAPAYPTREGYTFSSWDKAFGTITGDLTVTAQYTINTYTVTFTDKDGNTLKTETVNWNEAATAPADPVWAGHTFTGWNTDFAHVKSDLTVKPLYDTQLYTVRFLDWNDTELKAEKVEYGKGATAPANPTREGYSFTGWDKTYDNVTGDLTVKALYTINTYTVTFVDKDGAPIGDPQTVEFGSAAVAPTPPAVTGYTFKSWDNAFSNITGDLTVQALYEINTYTVKFIDKEGAQIGEAQTVEFGKAAVAPVAPAVEGYTFTGWDKKFDNITADLTVTAQYLINIYAVQFLDKDGMLIGDLQHVEFGSAAVAPTPPAVTGYTFIGWDNAFSNITGDLTVQALYEINTYTVKFVDKDGAQIGEAQTVEFGKAAVAPVAPAVEGYTFTGWDKAFDNISGNLTVKAQYAINTFTVTFTDKDGNTLKTETVNWNEAATAPADPVWAGHTFTGWNTDFTHVKSDLTVKPLYDTQIFTVRFLDWNDTELKAEKVEYGKSAIAPADPSREGYTFTGWDKTYDNVTGDLVVKAQYTINQYTVRFLDWNDIELKAEKVEYGKAATAPAYPTREGYTFTGWDKAFDHITGDLTVKAQYTINTYTVTFVDKDGAPIGDPQTVEHGKAAVAPTPPMVEGYRFTGWDKAFTNITGNMVITAQYAINTFTVTFVDRDGNTLKTETVNWNEAATAPADPVWAGHTFTGWDTDFTHVKSNLTVKPLYDTQLFTVRFLDWNGNELKVEKVEYGKSANAPSDPEREGYTFTGWDKTYDNVTGDLVVKAQYTVNIYTVTFVDWNGIELKAEKVEYGKSAIAPADPSREGYTFTGWDKTYDNVTGDLVVKAQYTIHTYTVTFVDKDGAPIGTPQTVEHGKSAVAPTPPAVEGYRFTGWDKAYNNVSGDITVKALYAINTYTVTFVDKDGNTLKTETVNWNEAATAPANPVWAGHTFAGWDTDFAHVKSDLTVKPLYDTQLYTVRFFDWNGNELKAEKVEYGKSAIAPANPTREGYTFTGWDKTYDNVTGDITVTAQYTINQYTVTFVDRDGNTLKTETVNWNEAATAPDMPAWEGHTFTGWDTDFAHVKSDLTVSPLYDTQLFTVRFLDRDGNEIKSETVEYGKGATAPPAPAVEGYTFTGWDTAFDNVTGDITVTAQYTIHVYTVTFVDWDGKELKTEQVEYGKGATAPADPEREGYTFTGWDTAFDKVTGNITVTAQYAIKVYTVTFVDWDDKELKTEQVEYGNAATAPADPEREGYTFIGWDTAFDKVTGNLVVKAQYEEVEVVDPNTRKYIINGILYIIKGERTYTASGQMVE